MAQCILVEGAMHSGKKPQCILVKSDEFENSYSLLYILLKSCLCCCSLATLAPQQLYLGTTKSFFLADLRFPSNF